MPSITVVTQMPADNAAGVELLGADVAEVELYCSAGSGTACLIRRGYDGRWRQYGPSWTVDTTQEGQQVARLVIPRTARHYQVLVTGGPTIGAAWLDGHPYGR